MPSLSDDIAKEMIGSVRNGVSAVSKGAVITGKVSKVIIGIAFKSSAFTLTAVLSAIKAYLYNRTDDIKFSNRNIRFGKLKKEGDIQVLDTQASKEVMREFDKYCKKYKIKYSVFVDNSNKNEPSYQIFFHGRNISLIELALKEAFKNIIDKDKDKDNKESEANHSYDGEQEHSNNFNSNKKTRGRDPNSPKKSIIEKIKFFRNRSTKQEDITKEANKYEYKGEMGR